MLIRDAIAEYTRFLKLDVKGITASRYLVDVNHLCVFLRNCPLEAVRDRDIIKYIELLQVTGMKHNAVVKKTRSLRSFWKWLNKKEYKTFSHELIPAMKQEWTQPRVATDEEYQKLLKAIPKSNFYYDARNDALVRLLYDTGARIGEILSLDLGDLMEKKAIVRTEKSKGKRPFREIYWTKETERALERWLERREAHGRAVNFADPQALFIGSSRGKVGTRLTSHGATIIMRKLSKKAGIPTLNCHSFRHHMGHFLAEHEVTAATISSILGHSNMASSFRYTELSDKERERAYRKYKGG